MSSHVSYFRYHQSFSLGEMVSDPKTAAVMEEDNFDEYEVDEEFKRIFWQGGLATRAGNGISDDQELRLWLKALLEEEDLDRHKDVVFIVGDKGLEKTVRAHRLILTTRSRTFAVILDGEPDPNKAIKITGTTADSTLLKFLDQLTFYITNADIISISCVLLNKIRNILHLQGVDTCL